MDIYCSKCKKKTSSVDVEPVRTANNKWRLKARCTVCGHEKSTFTKAPEPSAVVKQKEPLLSDSERLDEALELHRPVVKKFPRRKIITCGIDDLWAADLVIMEKYAHENDGYKYMLNVIDTFSKFAWSEPLTRKSGPDVARAFQVIIKRAASNGHHAPNLLHTDKGTEFVNRDFKRVLAANDIKMYHTENEEKSAIVERFNRTLNGRMKIQFEVRGSFRWIDILQGLIRDYNESYHRTIRTRPVDVTEKNESEICDVYRHMKTPLVKRPTLKVGDRVRIVAKKERFGDKYSRNWNREIFSVTEVMKTAPITYKIQDLNGEEILGTFYEQELSKTKF